MTDSEKLDLLLNKIVNIENEVSGIKGEVSGIKGEVSGIKDEVSGIKKKVTGIELHIENVTDKNIQTVAEGHLDLSRKLDNALRVENEKELLIIRVHILEDELRKIKEQIGEIA